MSQRTDDMNVLTLHDLLRGAFHSLVHCTLSKRPRHKSSVQPDVVRIVASVLMQIAVVGKVVVPRVDELARLNELVQGNFAVQKVVQQELHLETEVLQDHVQLALLQIQSFLDPQLQLNGIHLQR